MLIETISINNDADTSPATRIKDFGSNLHDTLSTRTSVLFDLARIRTPDIRIAQVVAAARNLGESIGATVTLAGPVDGDFIDLLDRVGFNTGEQPPVIEMRWPRDHVRCLV